MKNETAEKLNQINSDFYQHIAQYFDSSRQTFWEGWDQVWDFMYKNKIPVRSVLDMGCGNARFLDFLTQRKEALCHLNHEIYPGSILDNEFSYVGIDNDDFLLGKSREKFPKATFIKYDIVDSLINDPFAKDAQQYDMIGVFGVIHHVPSFDLRVEFLKNLKNSLGENGILILSIWKFMDDEKEKTKVVPWSNLEIDPNDLEPNDYLLSWNRGENALRYCHFLTDEEEDKLILDSGLKKVYEFYADGKSGKMNKYLILT